MVKRPDEIPFVIKQLLANTETETVEFKEANQNFGFEDIGKYFSALSNEANLRNAENGWLLFGVRNDGTICGTAYRKEGGRNSIGLQKLKHEIASYTNNGMTFEEIYEVEVDGKRVVAFQIPPAPYASLTTWRGIPWSREHESLVQMPDFKAKIILSQSKPDWSVQVSYEANMEDLDSDAVSFAREKYIEGLGDKRRAAETLNDEDILEKIGLVIHGRITYAALVLLGKPEASVFLGGNEPRITWTLYASDGEVIAYEHFEPPFITQVDEVLAKIRNERYRYFDQEDTLFPTVAHRYDPEIIRELLHNAIAHQDFSLSGKINILEFEDRLVFKNEGSFIPGSIELALKSDYKPPYYRNPLLSKAMSKTGMIDQNAIGIRNIYSIQKNRFLPMPTYDLSSPSRVSVTIYGKVMNEAYTRLLATDKKLDLDTVFLLDMVQKGIHISKEQAKLLRQRGLIEGRYPKLTISSRVAGAIGSHEEYVKQKGLDSDICKGLIVKLLETKPCTRAEVISAIDHALPNSMSSEQKAKHVSYLLQELRKEKKICTEGERSKSVWRLV